MEEYCRVLVIDDELIIRQGIKHMADWEKEGFQIVGEAGDGQAGLRMIEEFHPHIVLADIVMPVLDGLEFSALLKERYPEIRLIMLSSYDKFEFVRTALLNGASDYILKPMLNAKLLLKTLMDTAAKIPEVQFRYSGRSSFEMQFTRYMSGYQANPDSEELNRRLPHPVYRVLGIHLKLLSEERPGDIRKKTEELFRSSVGMPMISAVLDESVLCMVFNYEEKDDAKCRKKIQEFALKMARRYPRAFLVLSWDYMEFSDTRRIFEDGIRQLLTMKFYFPGKGLAILEGQPIRQEACRFEFETFSRHLESLELDQAVSMCMTYIEGLARAYEEEYKIKNLAKNLLFNYFVELERIGEGGEEIRDACFQDIDGSEDVEAFFEAIRKYVPNQAGFQKERDSLVYGHIEEMIEYIGIHYMEDLKLMDLARQFGFSYCYISTYFKENMAEGFSGYLNKLRIGKAKSLLLNSSQTIAEIGSEVGYTDQSYFGRVFKKLVGVTPGRYRKNSGRPKQ